MKDLSSVNHLIEVLETFPSIGRKSATRLAFEIARNKFKGLKLLNAIEEVVSSVRECEKCGNLSEYEVCYICDSKRENIVAVVENPRDILVIENSGAYEGYYFVLKRDNVDKLRDFIIEKKIEEVVFAMSPSVENELRMRELKAELGLDIKYSSLAKGIPMGVSLENVDLSSVGFAINSRFKIE